MGKPSQPIRSSPFVYVWSLPLFADSGLQSSPKKATESSFGYRNIPVRGQLHSNFNKIVGIVSYWDSRYKFQLVILSYLYLARQSNHSIFMKNNYYLAGKALYYIE